MSRRSQLSLAAAFFALSAAFAVAGELDPAAPPPAPQNAAVVPPAARLAPGARNAPVYNYSGISPVQMKSLEKRLDIQPKDKIRYTGHDGSSQNYNVLEGGQKKSSFSITNDPSTRHMSYTASSLDAYRVVPPAGKVQGAYSGAYDKKEGVTNSAGVGFTAAARAEVAPGAWGYGTIRPDGSGYEVKVEGSAASAGATAKVGAFQEKTGPFAGVNAGVNLYGPSGEAKLTRYDAVTAAGNGGPLSQTNRSVSAGAALGAGANIKSGYEGGKLQYKFTPPAAGVAPSWGVEGDFAGDMPAPAQIFKHEVDEENARARRELDFALQSQAMKTDLRRSYSTISQPMQERERQRIEDMHRSSGGGGGSSWWNDFFQPFADSWRAQQEAANEPEPEFQASEGAGFEEANTIASSNNCRPDEGPPICNGHSAPCSNSCHAGCPGASAGASGPDQSRAGFGTSPSSIGD